MVGALREDEPLACSARLPACLHARRHAGQAGQAGKAGSCAPPASPPAAVLHQRQGQARHPPVVAPEAVHAVHQLALRRGCEPPAASQPVCTWLTSHRSQLSIFWGAPMQAAVASRSPLAGQGANRAPSRAVQAAPGPDQPHTPHTPHTAPAAAAQQRPPTGKYSISQCTPSVPAPPSLSSAAPPRLLHPLHSRTACAPQAGRHALQAAAAATRSSAQQPPRSPSALSQPGRPTSTTLGVVRKSCETPKALACVTYSGSVYKLPLASVKKKSYCQ